MFNEYPYTNYEKINLDWLLDLGNKLKADAESGAFDGERGPGIFGITTIYAENDHYYAVNPGGVTVGDFIIGYGPAAGVNTLYLMKVTSVTGNYLNGTTLLQITGPRGEPGEGGLTEAMKQAFLQLAQKVAYIDAQGQTYYKALYDALYSAAVTLSSISAVFNQGSAVIYDTDSLDDLKPYLTVTANYSDSSSATVPSTDYTLSGTLTEGTSTITVSYGGKTDTFTVTVTGAPLWVFTNGYTLAKATTGLASGYTYRKTAAARACGHDPIENNNYVFTVTDSSKYNIAVYGIPNLTKHNIASTDPSDGYGYENYNSSTVTWSTTGSTDAPYVWIALKKMDGTAFTAEELANGASAVFSYTEGN